MSGLKDGGCGLWLARASLVLGVFAGVLPAPAARAATAGFGVEFDGTCEVGSCPPSALPTGETSFVPYAFDVTLANGDSFRVEGTLSAANSSGGTSATSTQAFVVTYLGNPSGQASQADTLTIDNLLSYGSPASPVQVSSSAAGAFYSVAASSSVAVTDNLNSNAVVLGPFPAPNPFNSSGGPVNLGNAGSQLTTDSAYTIVFGAGSPVGSMIQTGTIPGAPAALASSVLPGSRSVVIGEQATVFATVINTTASDLSECGINIQQPRPPGLTSIFQTTNPATNAPTGSPGQPVTIPAGAVQTFVLSFASTDALTEAALPLLFACSGAVPAPSVPGVNTIDLLFSATPIPDVIALAATATGDGTVHVANGVGAFAVATDNVGSDGTLTVSVDTGSASLPVTLSICQTNSAGQCLAPPAASVPVDFAAGATPTFSIFVSSSGAIAFAPGTSRVFVRFEDSAGASHGSTSVAITTN
jgi:hypothetical protein